MAFTSRRIAARRRGRGGESDAISISVRDAATLAATGPAIAPRGFAGAFVGSYYESPGFALTPDGRSVVIATDEGELVVVGPRQPHADQDGSASIADRATTRSRSARTGARSPSASTAASSWSTRAAERCGRRPARSTGPRAGCCSARTAGPWSRPASTGRSTLWDAGFGDPARDAARPLGRRPAAGLQPRRADALHGQSRRDGDRLGHRRRPRARAALHLHA